LLTPQGIEEGTKRALMERLTAHIEEAYPALATHIFVSEADRGDVMFAGVYRGDGGKEARVCTLLCPPGVSADAKRAMMANLHADILAAYPNPADTFIIHREDDPAHVMVNGILGSENPKYEQPRAT
jgi:phenylpyruvate tautomerase PptA (4-oxalocrotonate tautomerase family)